MKQYVVDAFTDKVFHGNQAAVCVLDAWLPDERMMDITRENNFSETGKMKNIICAGLLPAAKSICAVMPHWAQRLCC